MVHLNIPTFIEGMPQRFGSDPGLQRQGLILAFSGLSKGLSLPLEIIANEPNGDIQPFFNRNRNNRERACTAKKTRNIPDFRPLPRDQSAEIHRHIHGAVQGQPQLGTAFAAGEFMYLIDDHETDLGEVLTEPFSHEECLNGLRGGDKKIGRG